MPTETIAGVDVAVNDEGFLEQPEQWTEAMAVAIATHAGVGPLTPQHWQVINFMRKEYFEKGTGSHGARARQDLRRLGQGAVSALPQRSREARRQDRRDPEAARLHLTRRDAANGRHN